MKNTSKFFVLGLVIGLIIAGAAVFIQPYVERLIYGQNSSNCPAVIATPTSIQVSGFQSELAGILSIRPNSTAFVTISYGGMSYPAQDYLGNFSKEFKPIQYWVRENGNGNTAFVSDAQAGLIGGPINETITGTYSMAIKYELSASASAPIAIYASPFWDFCGDQLMISVT